MMSPARLHSLASARAPGAALHPPAPARRHPPLAARLNGSASISQRRKSQPARRAVPCRTEKSDAPGDAPRTQDEAGGFTKDYYAGMLSSPLSEGDRQQQLSGDRDGLKQNLKFAGIMSAIIVGLFLGFMASNGLI